MAPGHREGESEPGEGEMGRDQCMKRGNREGGKMGGATGRGERGKR